MKLYQDSASIEAIKLAHKDVKGFTTNPTLMRKAGITNYMAAVREMVEYLSSERHRTTLSVEVFADDHQGMIEQAEKIWKTVYPYQYDVYIKIPITYTSGAFTDDVIHELSNVRNYPVNVTAVFTVHQSVLAARSLNHEVLSIISVFAGRIADTGINPKKMFKAIKKEVRKENWGPEMLWASPRQVYDYVLAEKAGAEIITMTPDLIKKLGLFDKSLEDYSLDTVRMFFTDGAEAGYTI